MQISPNIFREYDIRGLVDKELTDDSVRAIARAVGTYALRHGKKTLALGRDVRLRADRFNAIVLDALLSTGCNVIDIGVVPTPLLYFSLFHLRVDGGVMITASHNPSEYNGFKLCMGKETIDPGVESRWCLDRANGLFAGDSASLRGANHFDSDGSITELRMGRGYFSIAG